MIQPSRPPALPPPRPPARDAKPRLSRHCAQPGDRGAAPGAARHQARGTPLPSPPAALPPTSSLRRSRPQRTMPEIAPLMALFVCLFVNSFISFPAGGHDRAPRGDLLVPHALLPRRARVVRACPAPRPAAARGSCAARRRLSACVVRKSTSGQRCANVGGLSVKSGRRGAPAAVRDAES